MPKASPPPPAQRRRTRRSRQKVSLYTDSNPSLLSEPLETDTESLKSSRSKSSTRLNTRSSSSIPPVKSNTNNNRSHTRRKLNKSSSSLTNDCDNESMENDTIASSLKGEKDIEEQEEDQDDKGVILCHRILHAPIFPSLSIRNNQKEEKISRGNKSQKVTSSSSQKAKMEKSVSAFLEGHHGLKMWKKGLKLIPEWKEMRYNNFFHDEDYTTVHIQEEVVVEETDGQKLIEEDDSKSSSKNQSETITNTGTTTVTEPIQIKRSIQIPPSDSIIPYVTRTCSCMAISPPPNNYLAIGDTAGYVTIYSTKPITTAMMRLPTLSSQRCYDEELQIQKEKKSNKINPPTKTDIFLKECFSHHPINSKWHERKLSVAASNTHAIEALAFSSFPRNFKSDNTTKEPFLLVISTKMEIEVHDISLHSKPKHRTNNNLEECNPISTLLWSVPTANLWKSGPVMRLSVHPTCGVLASFFQCHPFPEQNMDDKASSTTPFPPPNFSPLVLCRPNESLQGILPIDKSISNNIDDGEGDANSDTNQQQIMLGTYAVGIWDIKSSGDYIFLTALIATSNPTSVDIQSNSTLSSSQKQQQQQDPQKQKTQQILKIDSKTYEIFHRATLPIKVSGNKILSTETLRLTPDGSFVLASSAKGIRMFSARDLALCKIIGESIALHGHVIAWQDCFMITDYNYKHHITIEREDELMFREEQSHWDISTSSYRESVLSSQQKQQQDVVMNDRYKMYIVGIPHSYREPEEMKNTIHFWEIKNFSYEEKKLPTYTLNIPSNSGGIHGLFWRNSKMMLLAQDGECHEMMEYYYSEWPGKMYPPGYLVHEDNVEYIENEDELDIVVEDEGNWDIKDVNDDEDEEDHLNGVWQYDPALYEENEPIVVVDRKVNEEEEHIIPCRPEPFLQEQVYKRWTEESLSMQKNDMGMKTNGSNSSANFIFSLLPTISDISELRQKGFEPPVTEDVPSTDKAKSKIYKGKRYKIGIVEAALKSAIDKNVRVEMHRRQCWSSGEGCSITNSDEIESKHDETTCHACNGRMTIHTCGSRDVPIDHDLLARELQEKLDAEQEQKELERLAKKKAAEEKRNEEKRKRKRAQEEEKKKQELGKKIKNAEKRLEEEERKKRRKVEEEERKSKKKEEEENKRRRKLEEEERRRRKKEEEEERKLRRKQEEEERKRKKELLKLQKEEERVAKKKAIEDRKNALKEAKAQRALMKKTSTKKQTSSFVPLEIETFSSIPYSPPISNVEIEPEIKLASLLAAYITGNTAHLNKPPPSKKIPISNTDVSNDRRNTKSDSYLPQHPRSSRPNDSVKSKTKRNSRPKKTPAHSSSKSIVPVGSNGSTSNLPNNHHGSNLTPLSQLDHGCYSVKKETSFDTKSVSFSMNGHNESRWNWRQQNQAQPPNTLSSDNTHAISQIDNERSPLQHFGQQKLHSTTTFNAQSNTLNGYYQKPPQYASYPANATRNLHMQAHLPSMPPRMNSDSHDNKPLFKKQCNEKRELPAATSMVSNPAKPYVNQSEGKQPHDDQYQTMQQVHGSTLGARHHIQRYPHNASDPLNYRANQSKECQHKPYSYNAPMPNINISGAQSVKASYSQQSTMKEVHQQAFRPSHPQYTPNSSSTPHYYNPDQVKKNDNQVLSKPAHIPQQNNHAPVNPAQSANHINRQMPHYQRFSEPSAPNSYQNTFTQQNYPAKIQQPDYPESNPLFPSRNTQFSADKVLSNQHSSHILPSGSIKPPTPMKKAQQQHLQWEIPHYPSNPTVNNFSTDHSNTQWKEQNRQAPHMRNINQTSVNTSRGPNQGTSESNHTSTTKNE